MEIIRMISSVPVEGKEEEATKVLLKLAKYCNEVYSKYGQFEVATGLDGGNTLVWIDRYKSLAAFEEGDKAWQSDPKRGEFGAEFAGLTKNGQTHFLRVQK